MTRKGHTCLSRGVFVPALVSLCWLTPAQAAPITYNVTVNTFAILGTIGHLDFQFGAGVNSRDASAAISSFTSDGTLTGNPCPSTNVNPCGPLPAATTLLVVSNGGADYFHDFTFGSTLSFMLTLAFQAGNPGGTDDDTFGLALYNTDGFTPLLNNGSEGDFILTIDLHPDGTTTVHDASTGGQVAIAAIPEPATLPLSACGLLALALYSIRRRRQSSPKT